MCLLHVSVVGFFFTIRQKRIHGGSTYAECNSGQRDPAIVSLPRLARPGDTIDSVQLPAGQTPHTLFIQLYGGGRHTGREGGTEGARQDGESEGGREGGGREGGRVGVGNNERARGSDGVRDGGSGSGGREGRLKKGTSWEGT